MQDSRYFCALTICLISALAAVTAQTNVMIPGIPVSVNVPGFATAGSGPPGPMTVTAPGTNVNVGPSGGVGVQAPGGVDVNVAPSGYMQTVYTPCPSNQARFMTQLSGQNTVAANSTTKAPIDTPAKGVFSVCIDYNSQSAPVWRLLLCDITNYTASHMHVVSNNGLGTHLMQNA